MAESFLEYDVVSDLSPVDFTEHLEVLTGFDQPLEALATLRAGERAFGSVFTETLKFSRGFSARSVGLLHKRRASNLNHFFRKISSINLIHSIVLGYEPEHFAFLFV
jgi:hypothetical protein